jgi:hypothetical protein
VRWVKTLLGGVAAAALTAGCGTGSPTGSAPYDLPTGQRAASTAAVVFATGEELHIGTRTYPIRPAPQTMVDTAAGLYYLTHGVLYQWDRDHERSLRVADIGGIGWLSTTFDGRFLAFIDYEHGPRNLGGHRIAEAVVFDTTTGQQLVRDATGNGSRSGTEDLSDLYAESTPTILGFDDDAVYAQTAKGGAIARWDLEDGHRSDLGDNEYPVTENRPGGPLVDVNLVHGVPRETPAAEAGTARGRGAALSCWQAGPTQTGSTASPSTRPSAPPRR